MASSILDYFKRGALSLKKRLRDDDDDPPSNASSSASASAANPPKKRKLAKDPCPPLSETNASQTHNIRPRREYFACVEIPVDKSSQFEAQIICHDRYDTPIDEEIQYEQDSSSEAEPVAAPSSRIAATARGKSRAGRAFKVKQSFVLDSDVSDAPTPKRKSPKKAASKKKPQKDDDSDPDFTANSVAASESEDIASLSLDASSSVAAPSDDSELELPAMKNGAKKAAIKPNASGEDASTSATKSRQKGSNKQMHRMLRTRDTGLDETLAPLHDIGAIFEDITSKAMELGFNKFLGNMDRPLRIATMCSGTESPLLALELVRDALRKSKEAKPIEVEHIFSAEIVPYKQAYIERNFAPPIIFRDIAEFVEAVKMDNPIATTAYGAKVSIPRDPDIVVAGTSCVDFSRLNTHQKGLGDGGESDLTWKGAYAYCETYKPPIILFENVLNADWNKMLETYQELGYSCQGVLVDTKDYYIPHTRQRGYMVCIKLPSEDKQPSSGNKQFAMDWVKMMEKFKRPASSPVSSFMVPNDQVSIRPTARSDDNVREVDWSTCEITQMEYRQEKGLGNARPFTHWQESGIMSVPERGSTAWYRAQVERVLDTIDCCILRKALPPPPPTAKGKQVKDTMYDVRYKTRIWDLSQNVYRNEDTQPFGITGCITPSGQFFISDAGRAMTPEETLILQGLPLHKISFTTESPREVQDLAGNAMTATVIGPAILAALTAGSGLLEGSRDLQGIAEVDLLADMPARLAADDLVLVESLAPNNSIDMSTILVSAQKALRLCYCEGSQGSYGKDLQKCVDCGHTACLRCAGNPDHNFAPLAVESRISPLDFEVSLRSQLPLTVRLSGAPPLDRLRGLSSGVDDKTIKAYLSAMKKATAETFKFSQVRRTYCWTATYTNLSGTGRLELVIENDRCEWRLFAVPPANLPVQHPLRKHFVQPIGKSVVRGDLLDESWLWRPISCQAAPLNMTLEGAHVSTWWARSEMPGLKGHKQFDRLRIETESDAVDGLEITIDGLYQYLPKCGTACEGLYKRIEPHTPERPLFLFLDPSRTGSTNNDRFVFSHTSEVLEYDEVRPVVAAIKAPWRPWPTKAPFDVSDKAASKSVSQNAILEIESLWTLANSKITLESDIIRHAILTAPSFALAPDVSTCSKATLLVRCKVAPTILQDACDGTNKALDSQFVFDNAWIFEAMRRQLPESKEWIGLPLATNLCSPCAPSRPDVRWKLDDKDKAIPYEDPSTAAVYERSIKSRPDPLVVQTARTNDGVAVNLSVNLVTLAHRAMARLPQDTDPADVTLSWRLDTSHSSKDLNDKQFTLKATDDVEPSPQPVGMSVNLFPQQRLALAWMKRQEQGTEFVLEESEEASIPQLGWRVEVRAQAQVTVRGGICADHPGFGKTITSLALIHSDFKDAQSKAAVLKTLEKRRDAEHVGLSVTAATLIICPGALAPQWSEEAIEKLGYKLRSKKQGDIVLIEDTADLNRFSRGDFEQAKIIIVSRDVLGADAYTHRLASFAAVPGPADSNRRSYHHWLQFANQQVPGHNQLLQKSKGTIELKDLIKSRYRERLESDAFKAAVPSKRLRGKTLVAATKEKAKTAKEGRKKSTKTKGATADVDLAHVEKPLFQMFYYNRLIVDEFHEDKERKDKEKETINIAITALNADKIWGLSATPAMGDCYDIAQTAKLLHIPLRIGSNAKGIMKATNAKKLKANMTNFELFDLMRQLPSTGTQKRIQELGQLFLDTFVRQNIADHAEMPFQDVLLPVQLDLDHRVMYSELSQHLNSADMRMRKGNKSAATDRDTRLTLATKGSETPEEALSKTASFFDRQKHSANGVNHLIKETKAEFNGFVRDIVKVMPMAAREEKNSFLHWAQNRLTNSTLGDKVTITLLEDTMKDLRIKKETPLPKSQQSKEVKPKRSNNGESPLTTTNKLSNRLVISQRSLRFYENVAKLQAAYQDDSELMDTCDNADCAGGIMSTDDLAVSAHCGHIICVGCHGAQQTKQCVSDGCSSRMDDTQLLWASKMGDLAQTTVSPFGRKFEAVTTLLKSIKKQGHQAILFVQYSAEMEQAELALKNLNLNAIFVKESKAAADHVSRFKAHPNTHTVLVLNASNETAAGLNLQNANHVIFFSPLLRDSQYLYSSNMAQAMGRVKRYGQTREIFVYRVLALNTIDVDVLEQRERRADALTEFGHDKVCAPSQSMDVDGAKKVRTQLVKEDGGFSLRPRSWLLVQGSDGSGGQKVEAVKKKDRVHGWEDFSSLVKWSRAYTEDDD